MPAGSEVVPVGSKGQEANGVVISDFDEQASGALELQKISEMLHGGDVKARESFISVLFRLRGNVIIKAIPVSILGGLIAFAMVSVHTRKPDFWMLPVMHHPFGVQIFAIVLSFVIVARTTTAVSRYFQGVKFVHIMATRWVDAYTSLLGFLRASIDLHPPGSPKKDACVAVSLAMLHWGSLAHALAINSLQTTQLGIEEGIWEHRIATLDPPENLTLQELEGEEGGQASGSPAKCRSDQKKSRANLTKGAMNAEKRVSVSGGVAREVESQGKVKGRSLAKLGVYGEISKEERQRLVGTTDKVNIVCMWMEEALSRAQIQGVILISPPILARVYNELGSGLMGFNEAFRIALVPFPFCFSQLIGWCLVVFFFLCPAVAFVFTGGQMLTSTLTFSSMMGFWGLNRIAMELENPFGCEVNHLPLAEMHHAFIEAIAEMHQNPMPEYKWEQPGSLDPNEENPFPQLKRDLLK